MNVLKVLYWTEMANFLSAIFLRILFSPCHLSLKILVNFLTKLEPKQPQRLLGLYFMTCKSRYRQHRYPMWQCSCANTAANESAGSFGPSQGKRNFFYLPFHYFPLLAEWVSVGFETGYCRHKLTRELVTHEQLTKRDGKLAQILTYGWHK